MSETPTEVPLNPRPALADVPQTAGVAHREGSRPTLAQRITQLRLLLSDNGLRWTVCFALRHLLKKNLDALEGHLAYLERTHGLPGNTSVRRNYEKWQHHDWQRAGEEWTISPQWKEALIEEVMLRHIQPGKDVLEIGPGAGRWTETLQTLARNLLVVDLSDKCIEMCRSRFAGLANIQFFVNDGSSLPFVQDESIDYVWSFDVFVHIAPPDIDKYLDEIRRVLRPGALAIIHHANEPGPEEAWRSRMTGKLFAQMLEKHGFLLLQQFDRWGPEGEFVVRGDLVTVFQK